MLIGKKANDNDLLQHIHYMSDTRYEIRSERPQQQMCVLERLGRDRCCPTFLWPRLISGAALNAAQRGVNV